MIQFSVLYDPHSTVRNAFARVKERQWLKQLLVIFFFVISISLWQMPALAQGSDYGTYYDYNSYSNYDSYSDYDGYSDYDSYSDYDDYSELEAQQQYSAEEDTTTNDSVRAVSPPDIQRILDRDKLIVAVLNSDNAPFFMADDTDKDSLVGLDAKIAKGLADALGVELEFNRSADTFNGVVEQVYQLKADIAISKISQTLSRAQKVKFSRPYVNMRQGLLVNRVQLAQQANGKSTIQAIRDFSGDVGVIKGSSYVGFLEQKFPQATVKEYETWDDVINAVNQGEVAAAYRDELEVKKEILKNPDASLLLQTIALTDTKDSIAMVLPWDSGHMEAFVNQYLESSGMDYNADLVLEEFSDYLASEE